MDCNTHLPKGGGKRHRGDRCIAQEKGTEKRVALRDASHQFLKTQAAPFLDKLVLRKDPHL